MQNSVWISQNQFQIWAIAKLFQKNNGSHATAAFGLTRICNFVLICSNLLNRCYPIFNDILSRLSKQFITHANVGTPRHVLVDSSYSISHRKSYFPKIRLLLQRLRRSSDVTSKKLVKHLKFELSALATSFTEASNLLRGGLFGSLNALVSHLCPHFNQYEHLYS